MSLKKRFSRQTHPGPKLIGQRGQEGRVVDGETISEVLANGQLVHEIN